MKRIAVLGQDQVRLQLVDQDYRRLDVGIVFSGRKEKDINMAQKEVVLQQD